jgi:undecaprenyl-diphosphatase
VSFLQTILFAIIQGITELFPISSVAHGVLTPYVFHWHLDDTFLKEHFLPYVVMLHLGTALALIIFFRKDWIHMLQSIMKGGSATKKLLARVVVATIPAALIGVILEKPLRHLFSNVAVCAFFLIINGFLLYFGEKSSKKGTKNIEDLSFRQAFIVGLFQALALIPGFSRSGSSMTAGFWVGLRHEAAARFSMLMATPIIIGAGIVEVPKLMKTGMSGLLQMSLLGGIFSGLFAYISVWFLMTWFKKHEFQAMKPFAIYCWIVGVLVLVTYIL